MAASSVTGCRGCKRSRKVETFYVDTLFGDRRRSDGTDRTWERLGAATEAWGLTPSQSRVLARVAPGESNKEIATRLQCAENTVEAHLTALLRKSRAPGRVALAVAFWTLEA
jgi:DNA-binding NarL/FixJ family response regulator